MVAVRDIHLKDNFTLDEWVSSLTLSESDKNQLRTVYQYCLTLGDEALTNRLLVRGVEMVGILLMLSMDLATLKAAILYPFVEAGLISQEKVNEDFGPKIAKLVEGVLEMEAIRSLQTLHRSETSPEQVDNVRRMLLAMVEDVRAVVIKLAERIACLREAKKADEETRVLMAQEITNIYAPLRTASVSVSSSGSSRISPSATCTRTPTSRSPNSWMRNASIASATSANSCSPCAMPWPRPASRPRSMADRNTSTASGARCRRSTSNSTSCSMCARCG